jgi:GDP-4-dehydro-6-deoxy-D-mannose reductase
VNETVLITGASGFAGGHLVEHLTGRCDLVAWTRSDPPAALAPLARWTRIDLLDGGRVRQEIQAIRPSAVYHCAGAPHVAESWQDTARPFASNVLTTHYLLDALRRAGGASRVLLPGSATVYGVSAAPLREDAPLAPSSPYGISKLALEELGRRALVEDGLDVILTRPFNHIGPRQNAAFAVSGMARQIAEIERGGVPPVIRVGNLDAQRDLTDVRDIVRAYALLMNLGTPRVIYNIASGVPRAMRAVLDALLTRSRRSVTVEVDPARLRPSDNPVVVGDASRIREAVGWSPEISFDQMLDDILHFWRSASRA